MMHPGLPDVWVYVVCGVMFFLCIALLLDLKFLSSSDSGQLKNTLSTILQSIRFPPVLLQLLKIATVCVFLWVIYAGLMGSQIAERNIATVLTWNIWWAGLILSIFFLGSAWCAICPWNTLASWFVKPKLWILKINSQINLTPPKWMRSVWPALIMFVGLTWLELGYGVTTSPYATALLSLAMILMAVFFLALYKNRVFCHYICPVGRTVGFYSQLAPVELRPINHDVCADCTTLECFNGTDLIESCPTQLVMGRLTQNTYCTSCGNCVQSCPEDNISWRLRPHSQEAIQNARPHWDEAWFMLVLLALTSFHGITMMAFWEDGLRRFAQVTGDSGQLLISFSVGLMLSIFIPILIYSVLVQWTRKLSSTRVEFKKIFTSLVFVSLPLAFSYHLAHNLNHMIRESVGASLVMLDPLGRNSEYSIIKDQLVITNSMLLSADTIFFLQASLMMLGFWIAIKVLRHRSRQLMLEPGWRLFPMLIFIVAVNSFNLWMLMQPMVMRIGSLCVAPSI